MEMHADDDFTLAFDYASGATAERVQNPLWPLTEVFLGARMRKSVAIVKAFGKRIVDRAVEDRQATGGGGKKRGVVSANEDEKLDDVSGTLIQSLLDSIGDEQMVADAALNYLSAGQLSLFLSSWLSARVANHHKNVSHNPTGRDTTAQSLTWTFHLLLQHRYVYAKVRNEVQTLLDNNLQATTASYPPSSSTTSSLPFNPALFTPTSLPYTHAVFAESLRLHPPIPFEIKQAQSSTVLPDGTFLPASSVVVWCPWAMNRSHALWGADADSFRPERWLTPDSKVLVKSPSEFPVFNGGSRTCLGKTMAERVAVQVIAAVCWTFDFVPRYEGTDRKSKSSLTLPMEGGLPVFVKVRNRGRVGSVF